MYEVFAVKNVPDLDLQNVSRSDVNMPIKIAYGIVSMF